MPSTVVNYRRRPLTVSLGLAKFVCYRFVEHINPVNIWTSQRTDKCQDSSAAEWMWFSNCDFRCTPSTIYSVASIFVPIFSIIRLNFLRLQLTGPCHRPPPRTLVWIPLYGICLFVCLEYLAPKEAHASTFKSAVPKIKRYTWTTTAVSALLSFWTQLAGRRPKLENLLTVDLWSSHSAPDNLYRLLKKLSNPTFFYSSRKVCPICPWRL